MLRLWHLLTTGCWHHWEIRNAFQADNGATFTRYDAVCFCPRCGTLKLSKWKGRSL